MYRREALESRIKGFSNPVSIRGSLAVHALLAGIFAVAAGLIAFGLLADYTRRAVVPGYLQPVGGSVTLSALRPGRLSVDVSNGTQIEKGRRIARRYCQISFALLVMRRRLLGFDPRIAGAC